LVRGRNFAGLLGCGGGISLVFLVLVTDFIGLLGFGKGMH
jgi:hypothetical protein